MSNLNTPQPEDAAVDPQAILNSYQPWIDAGHPVGILQPVEPAVAIALCRRLIAAERKLSEAAREAPCTP